MNRYKKKIMFIKKNYRFSACILLFKLITYIIPRLVNSDDIIRKLYRIKYNLVEKEVQSCISVEKYLYQKEVEVDSYHVWIYWAQGWGNTPKNVERNLLSVKKNLSWANIVCIDDTNYDKYIKIPDFILDKKKEGKISLTHFSDILRVYLLSEYGGLWLDASAFVLWPISFEEINKPFFTVKTSKDITRGMCVSHSRWSIGFMGTNRKHYLLFEFMKKYLIGYWGRFDAVVDYFLLDVIVKMCLKKNKRLHKDLISGAVVSDGTYELLKIVNTASVEKLKEHIYLSSKIYYLSWKNDYKEKINGEITVYRRILDIVGIL